MKDDELDGATGSSSGVDFDTPKVPRKPRPSEIAAKKAKAAKKKKPAKRKAKKSAKRKPSAKAGVRKGARKVLKARAAARKPAKRKAKKSAKASTGVIRTQRLDIRLTKGEKVKVLAKAKKLRRTLTSLVIEAIEKLR